MMFDRDCLKLRRSSAIEDQNHGHEAGTLTIEKLCTRSAGIGVEIELLDAKSERKILGTRGRPGAHSHKSGLRRS